VYAHDHIYLLSPSIYLLTLFLCLCSHSLTLQHSVRDVAPRARGVCEEVYGQVVFLRRFFFFGLMYVFMYVRMYACMTMCRSAFTVGALKCTAVQET
jgi:hypothetical protein